MDRNDKNLLNVESKILEILFSDSTQRADGYAQRIFKERLDAAKDGLDKLVKKGGLFEEDGEVRFEECIDALDDIVYVLDSNPNKEEDLSPSAEIQPCSLECQNRDQCWLPYQVMMRGFHCLFQVLKELQNNKKATLMLISRIMEIEKEEEERIEYLDV